jgi:hypothetical protein
MPISIVDCWSLLIQSRLLSNQQCQTLSARFGRARDGQSDSDGRSLIKWLIQQKVISGYQGKVLLSGQRLSGSDGPLLYGSYKVFDLVEHGRLAGLLRARHIGTNHPVMIQLAAPPKDVAPHVWSTTSDLLPGLTHPNLVECFQAIDLGSTQFLVLEELRGASLEDWMSTQGRAAIGQSGQIVSAAAKALDYLHSQALAHGGIRPENIWLQKSGTIKLILEPNLIDLTQGPQSAPKSAVQERQRSDIANLGRVLYGLLNGKMPLVVASDFNLDGDPSARPLPKAVGDLMCRMMVKGSAPQLSAKQVVDQLAPFLGTERSDLDAPPLPTRVAYEQWLNRDQDQDAPNAVPLAGGPAVPPPLPDSQGAPQIAEVQIDRSGPMSLTGPSRHSRGRPSLGVVGTTLAIAALGFGLIAYSLSHLENRTGVDNRNSSAVPSSESNKGVQTPDPARGAAADDVLLSDDDGEMLWASPTDGEPLRLNYLPAGAQILFVTKLSEVAQSGEGERVLQALGPAFYRAFLGWQQAAGIEPPEIEKVIVGFYGNDGRFPRVSVVVHLDAARSTDDLLLGWRNPDAQTVNGTTYYTGREWAYYVPQDAEGRAFVMGNELEIKEVVASDLKTPVLRREIANLVRFSDADRQFNLLFAPGFLFSDGLSLFAGSRNAAMQPLKNFLGENLTAGLVSLHFSDSLSFLEMRMGCDVSVEPGELATAIGERLSRWADAVELSIARLNPDPYWGSVASRYPAMIRFLRKQTRMGVGRGSVVLNAALPPAAAHNLVFGAEMMLASISSSGISARSEARDGPHTLEEALTTKISVSFDQESLEFAVQNVERAFRSRHRDLPFHLAIRIVGEDLEQEGITRNQPIRDFRETDKTLGEILTTLVSKANPVAVEIPSDPEQKVVWAIGPDPLDSSRRAVLVTVRQVAEREYVVPEIFRTP